jgi:transposase
MRIGAIIGLVRFVEDGRLRPDNNRVENHIRPIAVGRKNWMFSKSPEGAHASALWYSAVETVKANGWEPYHYLNNSLPSCQRVYRWDYPWSRCSLGMPIRCGLGTWLTR